VLALLQELRERATVLYSTHILDDVQRVSDRVAILDHGRLVRASTTQELMASASHDRLSLVLGGADDSTAIALASLAGVAGVRPVRSPTGADVSDHDAARRHPDRPGGDHRLTPPAADSSWSAMNPRTSISNRSSFA
jgi:ABC-type multidrug transport system ATPase subunit